MSSNGAWFNVQPLHLEIDSLIQICGAGKNRTYNHFANEVSPQNTTMKGTLSGEECLTIGNCPKSAIFKEWLTFDNQNFCQYEKSEQGIGLEPITTALELLK